MYIFFIISFSLIDLSKVTVADGSKIMRIGLLSVDDSAITELMSMISNAGGKTNDKTQVVFDRHVPAYGYGKNHGWSKIIRIVRNIIPQSIQLLQSDPINISKLMDLQVI